MPPAWEAKSGRPGPVELFPGLDQSFEEHPCKSLGFTESAEIVLERAVEFECLIGRQTGADHHVADMHGTGQRGFILQFFKRHVRVVVVQNNIPCSLLCTKTAGSDRGNAAGRDALSSELPYGRVLLNAGALQPPGKSAGD